LSRSRLIDRRLNRWTQQQVDPIVVVIDIVPRRTGSVYFTGLGKSELSALVFVVVPDVPTLPVAVVSKPLRFISAEAEILYSCLKESLADTVDPAVLPSA